MKAFNSTVLILGLLVGAILTAMLPDSEAFTPTTWLLGAFEFLLLFFVGWLLLRNHPARPTRRGYWALGTVVGMLLVAPAIRLNTFNTYTLEKLDLYWLGAAAYAPITEETIKALAVFLLLTTIVKIDRPIAAVPVGIAVGVGFTIQEDIVGIAREVLSNLNSDLAGGIAAMLMRSAYGALHHSLWTGLAAWGIGQFLCRTDQPWGWRYRRLVGWWALAVALHTLANSFSVLNTQFSDANWPPLVSLVGFIAFWIVGIWLYLRSRRVNYPRGSVGSET